MNLSPAPIIFCLLVLVAGLPTLGISQIISAPAGSQVGTLEAQTYRALRYRPDGTDFVIQNGTEFFNRPLYGGNTAFRVDAGDKPEFLLYLPGRGGNLRFGITAPRGTKWLHDASTIVSRYRPGAMIYEIRDDLLGNARLILTAHALYEREGLLITAQLAGSDVAAGTELFWAYGGVNGQRGRRDGDIGTENIPISQYFQYRAEISKDNVFKWQDGLFELSSPAARIAGVFPTTARVLVKDGESWNDAAKLLDTAERSSSHPVLVGRLPLEVGKNHLWSFQRVAAGSNVASSLNETMQTVGSVDSPATSLYKADDLPRVLRETEARRAAIAGQVHIETPDPFINAAAAALNVGADAVWDEPQGAFMHGAIAWRQKLLGWRGPYLGDALGWHDRMRRHLEYWATRQNTSPIKTAPFQPDPTVNFARNEPELHSNGDMSKSHYDMNAVYIDALFRHILWTGDADFARKMMPVIDRHLAWERRLFRRNYGGPESPLYEAYVMIWASDDLQYHGSGVTHASAYNYYHHKMAARLARELGLDPATYDLEARLIAASMRRHLWLPRKGWFGEYKDLLGRGLVHENPALWTFYHTVDSEVTTPAEAWQMSRFVDTGIPHLPIRGKDVPEDGYATLSTTSWMPYTWSTNNVVMAEVMHTALAYWQTNRPDDAFKLYKSAILDSMYMGICPGNVGSMTYLDAHRRESQRDFADPSGTKSRAMIEGLFGVKPDLLARQVTIAPGFPADWTHARLRHPDIGLSFSRDGLRETFTIEPRFARPVSITLRPVARRDQVRAIRINGRSVSWKMVTDAVGAPRIEIAIVGAEKSVVEILWSGEPLSSTVAPTVTAFDEPLEINFGSANVIQVNDPQTALQRTVVRRNRITAESSRRAGHRTVFVEVEQGQLRWIQPVTFEARPQLEVIPSESQSPDMLGFVIRNNTAALVRNLSFKINGQEVRSAPVIKPRSQSGLIVLDKTVSLRTGTNTIELLRDGQSSARGEVTNWRITGQPAARLETVDLIPYFNDSVGNIFRNEYLAPRSPFVSLAIPKQGIGSWVHFKDQFEVNDNGLRELSNKFNGSIVINDIPLATPPNKNTKNIIFTSQWDNYPNEVTIPLSGSARHIYFLMAGSTNQMQSRFVNGEIIVIYTDGSTETLSLENPTNWWPIDQDYMIDDYAFRRPEAIPPRLNLATGEIRILSLNEFKTKGRKVPGGAATLLDLPLDSTKQLRSLTVRTIANEVVIGLMAATLQR